MSLLYAHLSTLSVQTICFYVLHFHFQDCGKMARHSSEAEKQQAPNLPTPGDTIGNPSAAYREIKMLVTLREDPVPFLEVLLHSHLASRTCACEWLQLSCSLSGFHCVLVKDTSDQTRLLRDWGHDRPLTPISKRLPSKGLARMPTRVAWISPLSPLFGVTGPETSLYSKDHGHPSTEAEHCLWTLYKPMTKIHLSS